MKKGYKPTSNPILRKGRSRGMDTSLPGFRERWKQLLAWACAKLPRERRSFSVSIAINWGPKNKNEREELIYIKELITATTATDIGGACCNPFLLKGLATVENAFYLEGVPEGEDAKLYDVVNLGGAFRRLVESFYLTDDERRRARERVDNWSDKLPDRPDADLATALCIQKFLILKKADEDAKKMEDLAKYEFSAKSAKHKTVWTFRKGFTEIHAPPEEEPIRLAEKSRALPQLFEILFNKRDWCRWAEMGKLYTDTAREPLTVILRRSKGNEVDSARRSKITTIIRPERRNGEWHIRLNPDIEFRSDAD
jgi:hypothetical protein